MEVEFVGRVMARLMAINAELEEYAKVLLTRDTGRMFRGGWSEDDAARCLMCTEEVNPHISEKVACDRMREIHAKYPPLGV